jgi:two-component system, OmpR family, sensor histidine kinase KdpD
VIRGRFVLLAAGAALVAMGTLAPPGADAQEPPPSSPPELGLPPAPARPPEVEAPAVTARGAGVSPRNSRQADDESFGSAVVGTFTEPGKLVGALTLALGLGLIVGTALHFRRHRGRREPREQSVRESLPAAPAKLEARQGKTDRLTQEKANRQKSELLDLVSQELRSPLTAMKGFVDTVRFHWDELPGARRRDVLDRASLNAEQLHRVFDQLLDFFRVDAHLVTMKPRPIMVSDAVERTLDDLRPVLANHRVYVNVPDGLVIRADVAAFGDVLTSLLTNAARFSPAGGRIIVRATRADGAVDMAVSDEGSGIPPEEQKRIFDPFYQSPYNNELRRGTGIGLTIAKRLTEMHGGRIAVASEPGVGSTFWVTMPLAAGPVHKIGGTLDEVGS